MKITNVKVDVFDWITDKWQVGFGMNFGGKKQLSVIAVETDEGDGFMRYTWSSPIAGLEDGEVTVTVHLVDAVGNASCAGTPKTSVLYGGNSGR